MATSGSLGKAESKSNTCKRVKLHLHCVCFVVCLHACFSLALAQLGLWSHWGLASQRTWRLRLSKEHASKWSGPAPNSPLRQKKPKDSFHKKQRLWIPWKKIPTEKKAPIKTLCFPLYLLKESCKCQCKWWGVWCFDRSKNIIKVRAVSRYFIFSLKNKATL